MVMAIFLPIGVWVEQLKQEWQQDPEMQKLIQEIVTNSGRHSKFTWENNLLKYKERLWVGKYSALKQLIMYKAHGGTECGHSGVRKP